MSLGVLRPKISDFITTYMELLSRITDAPQEFQEAAALFLLSTIVGRKWIFQSLPETSIFRADKTRNLGRPLNVWFVLLGQSRITRKSTGVVRHVEDLVKEVLGERPLLSKAFTPEYMVKEMSGKTSGDETNCIWISDEIAGFFEKLRKRGSYMTSADAVLSTIYDGSTYTTGTIEREREIVRSPYLTLFLSSTNYLPTLFDELHIRLGFLNRFIYVIGERKERKPLRTEPLTEEEKKEVEEIVAFLEALAERTSVTMMKMTNEAKQLYDSFEEEIERRIVEEDLGIKEGYCGQLPNLVARLASLYRISRMTTEEIRNYSSPILIVEKKDVERAIDYTQKAWNWFEKTIEIMLSNEPAKLREKERSKIAILEYLADGADKHVIRMQQYVTRRAGASPATFYNALKELRKTKVEQTRRGFYRLRQPTSEEQEPSPNHQEGVE